MLDALGIVALAFAVVFTGMAALTALMYALNAARRIVERRTAVAPPPESIDPRTLAVLAAAAHAALGPRARIHRIHVHRERGDEAWTRVGRMDLLLTHRVHPRQPS